jgi:hypothetical protein
MPVVSYLSGHRAQNHGDCESPMLDRPPLLLAVVLCLACGHAAFANLFVGRGYVVSVRHGASTSYAAVRERCEACPTVLSQDEDYKITWCYPQGVHS